jgi:hypothetical protein
MLTPYPIFCHMKHILLCLVPLSSLFLPAFCRAADVLYLKERISVVTDSGIIGVLPGTKVQRIGDSQSGIRVKTNDGIQLEVKAEQVTAVQTESGKLSQSDAATQAAASAQAQSAAAKAAADREAAARKVEQSTGQLNKAQSSNGPEAKSSAASLNGSALDGPHSVTAKVHPYRFPKKK